MTHEEAAELEKWASHAIARCAIEEFIADATRGPNAALEWTWKAYRSLDNLLDEFFGIDRPLLESARRALLAGNAILVDNHNAEGDCERY